jgi:hypothetical protein
MGVMGAPQVRPDSLRRRLSKHFLHWLELRDNYGFSKKELGKIVDGLFVNLTLLCIEWRKIHGYY